MQHLTRKQFLDLDWGAAELDAAAEFWLRLYEAAAPRHNLSTPPSYAVEVRLRGFPRAQAGGLRDELKRRLAAGHDDSAGSAPATIDRPDPDTLTVTFGPDPGDRAPPAGLGLPLLAGATTCAGSSSPRGASTGGSRGRQGTPSPPAGARDVRDRSLSAPKTPRQPKWRTVSLLISFSASRP